MNAVWIVLGIAAALAFLALALTVVCFYLVFYVPRRKPKDEEAIVLPVGKIYEPYRELMTNWIKQARALPHEDVAITSFDGLTLRGKYYEYEPDAPVEIMFHGYRGNAERDMAGGVQRSFACGHSALVVDQRAAGSSDGHVISFGVNESRDCRAWVEFAVNHFGPDVKLILTGISMGAATVVMAAGTELPKNVVGVLADCGYTSAREIIKKCIRQIKLPENLLYPFIKLAAKLFGRFDLEQTPPIEAAKRCRVPVIFIHGEADDFVPCEMSVQNYEACVSPKLLYTVPGAGHGLAFPVDEEGYLRELRKFAKLCGLQ